MYFIFTSFWNYKFYYVYGFILLVFTILLIVSACVSIVITYYFYELFLVVITAFSLRTFYQKSVLFVVVFSCIYVNVSTFLYMH